MGSVIPDLPDDLATHCLLRTSRRIHGLLRCVCRRWRDLLASLTFFDLRASQGLSQEWLYVMLRTSEGEYKWYTLEEERRLWIPLPPMPRLAIGAACAVIAGRLFMIGGSLGESASRNVWSYSARLNLWEQHAPMTTPREFAAAGVVGGQIYVLGGCSPGTLSTAVAWAEVYDPLANRWRSIQSLPQKWHKWMHGYAVLREKIFAVTDGGGICFDPASLAWDAFSLSMDACWKGRAAVVQNILYSCSCKGKLLGYDIEEDSWQDVVGWEEEVPKMVSYAMLTNVAGKLFVLWEIPCRGWETQLALAALDVYKESGTLRGKVLWYHVVSCSMLVGTIVQSVSLGL